MKEQDLESLFDAARADPPKVSETLAARVLEDAKVNIPRKSGWRDWIMAVGGKRGLGGLITATCVGFWIGLAPPQGLPDLAGLVLGQDVLSMTESDSGLFGWGIDEG